MIPVTELQFGYLFRQIEIASDIVSGSGADLLIRGDLRVLVPVEVGPDLLPADSLHRTYAASGYNAETSSRTATLKPCLPPKALMSCRGVPSELIGGMRSTFASSKFKTPSSAYLTSK